METVFQIPKHRQRTIHNYIVTRGYYEAAVKRGHLLALAHPANIYDTD